MTHDDDCVSARLIKADAFVEVEVYDCGLCGQGREAGKSSPHVTSTAAEVDMEGICPARGGSDLKFFICHPPTTVVTGHVGFESFVLRPSKAEFERNSLANVVQSLPLCGSDL